jgi:hypothetical protein
MGDMVYVVIASSGEYSSRCEWVCGVFTSADEAKRIVSEKSEEAAAARMEAAVWDSKRARLEIPLRYQYKLVVGVIGERPQEIGGDAYRIISVELDIWGEWEQL